MVVMEEYFADCESRLADHKLDTEETGESGTDPANFETEAALALSGSLVVVSDEEIKLEISEMSR